MIDQVVGEFVLYINEARVSKVLCIVCARYRILGVWAGKMAALKGVLYRSLELHISGGMAFCNMAPGEVPCRMQGMIIVV